MIAVRGATKSCPVKCEQQRPRAAKTRYIEHRASVIGREDLVHSIPVFTPEYLLPS